jgi:hypothetical protein
MEEICEGDLLCKLVHQYRRPFLTRQSSKTYITSEVLLLSQDGLVYIQLTFELRDELLDALLVCRLPAIRLVHPLDQNATHDRLKMRIFDARRLLELGTGLGLGGDQLWAGSEGRNVATDGARLEKFKAVVLLLDDRGEWGRR